MMILWDSIACARQLVLKSTQSRGWFNGWSLNESLKNGRGQQSSVHKRQETLAILFLIAYIVVEECWHAETLAHDNYVCQHYSWGCCCIKEHAVVLSEPPEEEYSRDFELRNFQMHITLHAMRWAHKPTM
jgi:hypothetical protein